MIGGIRTDLALEARQLWQNSAGQTTKLEGVRAREGERFGLPVTVVEVLDERGEKALDKGRGTYVTVELAGLARREKAVFARSVRAVAEQLRGLLGDLGEDGCVLVAGLGLGILILRAQLIRRKRRKLRRRRQAQLQKKNPPPRS